MIEEIWKPCHICLKYEVSNYGRVRNNTTKKILTPYVQNRGYLQINFYDDNKTHKPTIHRLVARAFLGESSLEVNHKDMNKKNNHVSNLEYVTHQQNSKHAASNMAWENMKPFTKLNEVEVIEIRKLSSLGYGYGKISNIYNVDKSTIAAIIKRKTWKHII